MTSAMPYAIFPIPQRIFALGAHCDALLWECDQPATVIAYDRESGQCYAVCEACASAVASRGARRMS